MFPHGEAPEPVTGAPRTAPAAAGTARWRPWRQAWADAAYGPAGFWSVEQPHDHFATGVGAGPLVAAAVAGLAPADVGVVVDVGAGDGALLHHLLGLLPGVALVGVDRRPRPAGLDRRVGWRVDHWDPEVAAWTAGGPSAWCGDAQAPLLVAHEWLDDLPTTVAARRDDAWREVEVDPEGAERTGPPVRPADAAWLDRWWPAPSAGARAEVGRIRDVAWAALVRAAVGRGGRALAVDYGHRAGTRPSAGSLVAYAGGRQRRAVPDGSVNLTAGVAVDALAFAGEDAGATTLVLEQQAAVLADLSLDGLHGHDRAEESPLAGLVRRSERAALTSPDRWGGLWWLLQGGPASTVS